AAMGAHAISNSYGGGEAGTQNDEQFYNYAGIAVTVSSGDNGFGVEFPASSPHVTAVGGTTLNRASGTTRGFTETAWDGAGSGCSAVYAKPTWQQDTGCSRRTVADVSAVADPNTGVAVFGPSGRRNRSAWLVFGGTGVGAPLIAGLYGVNDTAVDHGSDPYRHTANLHDVTSGSNGTCNPAYLCTAVAGYDGPTGLGTPNGVAAFGQGECPEDLPEIRHTLPSSRGGHLRVRPCPIDIADARFASQEEGGAPGAAFQGPSPSRDPGDRSSPMEAPPSRLPRIESSGRRGSMQSKGSRPRRSRPEGPG